MSAGASESGCDLVSSAFASDNQLHLAVDSDNLTDCKYLLRHQAALQHQYNGFGLKPLHQAIRLNNYGVLRCFLKKGSTEVRTSDGANILQYAAQHGHCLTLRLVMLCLGRKLAKAFADEVDLKGRTALHLAAATGSRENVCLLLKISKRSLHHKDSKGMLPFHHALASGYYFTAELISDLMGERFEDLLLKRPESFLAFLEECFDPWMAEQAIRRCPKLVQCCISRAEIIACAERNTKVSWELLEILGPLDEHYSA